MSRKKKIIIILHLCLAFSYLFWLLTQPYVKEIVSKKTQLALYETVIENNSLFSQLSSEDQLYLLQGYKPLKSHKPAFFHELSRLFFVDTPPFALAWLFFSLVVCVLLLLHVDGAFLASWLLPLIAIGYAYFLDTSKVMQENSLFPAEEYVMTHYVSASEKEAMNSRSRLLLGWHRYLINEWALENPSSDEALFKEQLERGLFAFNVARLKWILGGQEDAVVTAGFASAPSLFRLAGYFIWNLFFAWLVNRKEKSPLCAALSAQTS